jgi:hypothetical protein
MAERTRKSNGKIDGEKYNLSLVTIGRTEVIWHPIHLRNEQYIELFIEEKDILIRFLYTCAP